jgi:hypothetical protein
VHIVVPSLMRRFGGDLPLQLLQLADHVCLGMSLSYGLEYLIISCWCTILGERCATLCLVI